MTDMAVCTPTTFTVAGSFGQAELLKILGLLGRCLTVDWMHAELGPQAQVTLSVIGPQNQRTTFERNLKKVSGVMSVIPLPGEAHESLLSV